MDKSIKMPLVLGKRVAGVSADGAVAHLNYSTKGLEKWRIIL